MNALIVGASGQVGSALRSRVGGIGTAHRHPAPGLVALDLSDLDAVRNLVREVRPGVCYLAGAWTHMDAAEEQPEACRRVNVSASVVIAEELRLQGGLLVFFSTDHVFGERDMPWREDEPTAPVSVYAQSKAEAEAAIRSLLPERHLILRTSWVFGPDTQGRNFVHRVRNTLGRGEVLTVPNDQWGQPTFAPNLAEMAVSLVGRGERGTFHVVGPQWLTRFEWAQTIARTLRLDAGRIEGRPTSTFGGAPRPRRVGLDGTKVRVYLAVGLPAVRFNTGRQADR